MSIDRSDLKSSKAEHYLCGARCDVRLTIDPGAEDDVPGQSKLPGHDGESINSVVDIKSYRVSPDKFGTGLTFAVGEVDIEALSHFANSKGRMLAVRVGDAGTEEDGAEEVE